MEKDRVITTESRKIVNDGDNKNKVGARGGCDNSDQQD